MKLAETIKLGNLQADAAGTGSVTPDSRSADEWIKGYLDRKNKRLNDMRVRMNTLLGPEKGEVHGSWNIYKPIMKDQHPEKVAMGGRWAVTDPEGLIISTWETQEEAEQAAFPLYKGFPPSSTSATGQARVHRLSPKGELED